MFSSWPPVSGVGGWLVSLFCGCFTSLLCCAVSVLCSLDSLVCCCFSSVCSGCAAFGSAWSAVFFGCSPAGGCMFTVSGVTVSMLRCLSSVCFCVLLSFAVFSMVFSFLGSSCYGVRVLFLCYPV